MKEIEFNRENAIKVITELADGFVKESAENVLRSKIKGEDIDMVLYGMAKASSLFLEFLLMLMSFTTLSTTFPLM